MDFSKDMSIDESALDVEWLNQPRLLMAYSKELAEARKKLEKSKQKLEVVKAELDKDIRSNPDKYELSKITEGVVANTILLQSQYQEVNEALLDEQYEFDMLRNAVSAINMRKEALENLVKLHGMNYFAGPSVPRDLSKEWENQEKQKMVNSKIKFKRRKAE